VSGGFGWTSQYSSLALVFEPIALTIDVDDGRMMEHAIEHRGGEYAVAGESAIPTAKGEIRGEDHRAMLVAPRDQLEEQVGLLAAQRQVFPLLDQELRVGLGARPCQTSRRGSRILSGDLEVELAYLFNDLKRLEGLRKRLNFFKTIGATRAELRHSDFLAFLFSPLESHGLGDRFLKLFLSASLFLANTGRLSRLTRLKIETLLTLTCSGKKIE
jgi:PD-(D/E)XK nuclease superfamily